MEAIASDHQTTALEVRMAEAVAVLSQRAAHPARSVVLLPYAQLIPLAKQAWARLSPTGFAPRCETSMNWSRSLGGFTPGPDDLAFDRGRDLITAQALLERAGLGAQRELLASQLVDAAMQLASLVAAEAPGHRSHWALSARALVANGLEAPVLAVEAALARIALEWVLASSYATDVLFEDRVLKDTDCLVVLDGLQADPLTEALKRRWGDKAVSLRLQTAAAPSALALHPTDGPEDEAERAAACVLRHLHAGRVPVALAATDRTLTRRIRAMLGARGVAVRDETGWKLSTTRAAAQVMLALRASGWQSTTDTVLDWLKNAPALEATQVSALEATLRRLGASRWPADTPTSVTLPDQLALWSQVAQWRQALQASRLWLDWLTVLRETLMGTGQWPALEADPAGQAVIAALRLAEGAVADWVGLPQAGRRMGLANFTAWVSDVLESASFKPPYPDETQVVVVPLGQMLALPFAAVVLPGCDEVSLPASPEPPGQWTRSQRAGLGLPSREALAATQYSAWQHALTYPEVDVLWRQADATGEPMLPSPLVQGLQLSLQSANATPGVLTAPDPRVQRAIVPEPVAIPRPVGQALPVARLSASAYDDLRRCPYRFFALRQLGLQEVEELATEVNKRDFGIWLHAVLRDFHEAQAADPLPPGAARVQRLDALAEAQTQTMGLADGEFLPFAASWPGVRDAYLHWLTGHEASGARFVRAEQAAMLSLRGVTLSGRLDRVDTQGGVPLVMDYKTESLQTTKDRTKVPTEDTQLLFYAALLEDDTLYAAYVNLGDRAVNRVDQPAVVPARTALVEGIVADMAAIARGAPLPALGEGSACDHCAARGLCRKDFWS